MKYNIRLSGQPQPAWRKYQKTLRRTSMIHRLTRRMLRYSPLFPVLALAVYGVIAGLGSAAGLYKQSPPLSSPSESTGILSKNDVRAMLSGRSLMDIDAGGFDMELEGAICRVDTSIDMSLQNYIFDKMDRSTARQISVVAMEPDSGRIVLMAGFNKIDPAKNPCIDNKSPAASIFKIVTTAAAIETCGLNSSSIMTFNGGKYTLYRSQLKERKNKYTNRITLKDSFAQSVNPVFGKIGVNYLGKEYITKYAEAFGFNRDIKFELPLSPSSVSIPDEPYQLAEIASGFNRKTTLSPLHGVLLSAAVLNKGTVVEPAIVDRITSENGDVLYTARASILNQAITPGASDEIKQIMRATVISGTCKSSFKGYSKDTTLSRLNLGGKTGSISSRKIQDVRYDWFVGYAEEKKGTKKIAVAVLVVHEKYIGKRAAYYARMVITHYFQNYFAENDKKDMDIHNS